jgi:helix-turn-helix protein
MSTESYIVPEVITPAEAALECRRSVPTIRRWMRTGLLESIELPSGRRVIPLAALGAFQRTPAAPRRGQNHGGRYSP